MKRLLTAGLLLLLLSNCDTHVDYCYIEGWGDSFLLIGHIPAIGNFNRSLGSFHSVEDAKEVATKLGCEVKL